MSLYPPKADDRDIFCQKNQQRILFEFAVLMPLEEISRFLYYDAAQGKNSNHIWNCHQSVKDISDRPDSTDCHIRSDKYSKNVDPAVNFYMFHIAAA